MNTGEKNSRTMFFDVDLEIECENSEVFDGLTYKNGDDKDAQKDHAGEWIHKKSHASQNSQPVEESCGINPLVATANDRAEFQPMGQLTFSIATDYHSMRSTIQPP